MAFEVPKSATAFKVPKRKSRNDSTYYQFIAGLPCIITGRQGVQICHVSFANPKYGAYGRGLGRKADSRWVLPMTPEMHTIQHSGSESGFWAARGINPHFCCLVIYGLFNEAGMDALPEAEAFIRAREFQP